MLREHKANDYPNGNYQNRCNTCGCDFIGAKHCHICLVCFNEGVAECKKILFPKANAEFAISNDKYTEHLLTQQERTTKGLVARELIQLLTNTKPEDMHNVLTIYQSRLNREAQGDYSHKRGPLL
jgi:hypothetical protein